MYQKIKDLPARQVMADPVQINPVFSRIQLTTYPRTTDNLLFNFPVIDVLVFVFTAGHAVCTIRNNVEISLKTG